MRKALPDDVLEYYREAGKSGGRITAKNMTAAERTARAIKASQAAVVARAKKKQRKNLS
jgi:hypothetical protein